MQYWKRIKIMPNNKLKMTNESRSSMMGVDECQIPKSKLTNTTYES